VNKVLKSWSDPTKMLWSVHHLASVEFGAGNRIILANPSNAEF